MIDLARRWYCPNCSATDVTREARIHVRYHICPGLRYLSAPMLPVGTKAKVELHEREDYEGEDAGQTFLDSTGRPVMSIVTTRDEGTDVMVFAPTATARA